MFAPRVVVLTSVLGSASLVGLAACPAEIEPPKAKREPAPTAAQERARVPEPAAKAPAAADAPPSAPAQAEPEREAKAKLRDDVPLPIANLLGKSPAEVEAQLGEHLGKGMARTSCIRFTPDRVFFECAFAYQRYGDETGTFKAIAITYEDSKSVGVAFEGLPGEGTFSPEAALAKVGLELPSEGRLSQPRKGVNLWSWFNDQARLDVHGQQYRVEVSSVDNAWASAKVDIIVNSPLTEAQRAKVKEAKPRNPAG